MMISGMSPASSHPAFGRAKIAKALKIATVAVAGVTSLGATGLAGKNGVQILMTDNKIEERDARSFTSYKPESIKKDKADQEAQIAYDDRLKEIEEMRKQSPKLMTNDDAFAARQEAKKTLEAAKKRNQASFDEYMKNTHAPAEAEWKQEKQKLEAVNLDRKIAAAQDIMLATVAAAVAGAAGTSLRRQKRNQKPNGQVLPKAK